MTIGESIRKAREEKGYSRQRLADESGVALYTIVSWEWGRSTPTIFLLMCIADVLEVSLDELVGREFKR